MSETLGPRTGERIWQALRPSLIVYGDQDKAVIASTPGESPFFERVFMQAAWWDREASDALAALFSSSWLWESSLARRGGSDHLTIEQVIRAWWALSLIAENGGESVTFAQNRPPRGGISASFSENDLRHLHDLGLITFEKASGQFTLGRGARLEELRRTFAEELERRRVTA